MSGTGDSREITPLPFRKKPVEIVAVRVWYANRHEVAAWCGGRPSIDTMRTMLGYSDIVGVLAIPTLEGEMWAANGDWIIRGVQGEFYPCKPDIFAATYEAVAQ